jgi:hypothetical protein
VSKELDETGRIVSSLYEAFSPTPYNPEQLLSSNQTATYFTGDEEKAALANLLSGKTWQSVDVNALDRHHDILFFLPPEAFVQLLPAFLSATVTKFDRFDRLAELLSNLLTRDFNEPKRFEQRISRLSTQQRMAVTQSLERLEALFGESWEENPAALALQSFWRGPNAK